MDLGIFGVAVHPFACTVLRTTGLLASSPVLGSRNVPWPVKIGLSLMTAYAVYPFVEKSGPAGTYGGLVGAALSELAIGILLGFLATVVMSVIETAGHLIDVELGLGLANVIDPQFGHSSPLMGAFNQSLLVLVFLMLNGHHMIIRGLLLTLEVLPPGQALLPASWAEIGIAAFGKMLMASLVLACPVWAASLIVDVTLGIVARSVPQINVFVVGMPVKTLVGLLVLSVSIGFYGAFMKEISESIRTLFEGLIGVLVR